MTIMMENKTRFASLDAIPPHRPGIGGAKGVLATLYVRRSRTLPALAAALACSVVAFFLVPWGDGAPTPSVRYDVAAELPAPALEIYDAQKPSSLEVTDVVENRIPAVVPDRPAAADVLTKMPEPAPAVVLPTPQAAAVVPEQTAPRKIIPVSEAMSLYDPRPNGEPSKVDAAPKADAPFFADGLPTEEETLAFFRPARPSPTQVGSVEPSVPEATPSSLEDMSPTIALPESVPLPATRPSVDGRIEFRIVQGDGVQSGFVLFNKDDKNLRRYFVVARAYRSGASVPWKFKDIADGREVTTDKFAVEVSEAAFLGLSNEKKKFGKVVHEVLGTAAQGGSKVDWSIESSGNMLAAPEEGKGR